MIEFFSTLTLGAALGYCICLFRVNELQGKVNQLKIDALHESNKQKHIDKLSAQEKGGSVVDKSSLSMQHYTDWNEE